MCVQAYERLHLKCSQCNNFLGGKVVTAIYCETCDQYFHLPCFELNTSEEIEEDDACIYIESGILLQLLYDLTRQGSTPRSTNVVELSVTHKFVRSFPVEGKKLIQNLFFIKSSPNNYHFSPVVGS